MNTRLHTLSRRMRGSAFLTVIIFTFIMCMLVASILGWSLTERRINMRTVYWIEARNAAEALCEYGASQVVDLYKNYATPPAFDPYGGSTSTNIPLVKPPASFFGNVKLSHIDTDPLSSTNANGIELLAGKAVQIPSTGNLYYVDPADPSNANDDLRTQSVARHDIIILAKATAMPPNGDEPVSAYVTETVSVRGAPLFANAIFYANNDLELTNVGPVMNVWGPVHVNGDFYVSCDNSLTFHYGVSTTGNVYHSSKSSSSSGNNGAPNGGTVSFAVDAGGAVASMYNNDLGKTGWKDSTMGADAGVSGIANLIKLVSDDFSGANNDSVAYAHNKWNDNLKTGAMGATPYNPAGFTLPVDSNGDLPDSLAAESGATGNTDTHIGYDGTLKNGNVSYINDPPDQSLSTSDTYYTGKNAVEQAKFSNQAGLYVLVQVNPGSGGSADTATITYYGPPDSSKIGSSGYGPNGGAKLGQVTVTTSAAAGNEPTSLVSFVPYQATAPGTTSGKGTVTTYSTKLKGGKYYYYSTPTTNATITQTINRTYNGTGSSDTVTGTSFTGGTAGATVSDGTGYASASAALAAAPGGGATTYSITSPTTNITATSATVTSGMYDRRQSTGIDLVQIDMKALNTALRAVNTGSTTGAIMDNTASKVWGSSGWNGAIYVDVEAPSGSQASIGLINGQTASKSTSMIPNNPTTGQADSIVGPNQGLTIATNAPAYIEGSFNADGSTSTGTSQIPDDNKTTGSTSAEVPAAIVADAITILSPGYFGTKSDGTPYFPDGTSPGTSNLNLTNGINAKMSSDSNAYKSFSTNNPSPANLGTSGPEIAAAFIAGIDATTDAAFSGGAHNFPRFLEKWGGIVTIRGSIVNLFDSKIATGSWGDTYYSAPTRNWGFDSLFQNGTYPPFTPHVISFRRIYFNDLSATAYSNLRTDTTKGWPGDASKFPAVH